MKHILNKFKFLEKNEANQYIIEGIDIDKVNKIVSINYNHEDGVDTSSKLNPTYNKFNNYDVISIFKRKKTKDFSLDGNPLIYALKSKNNWKLSSTTDIFKILKSFIKISKKINNKYDTIIKIPSNNDLNTEFLYNLDKVLKFDNIIDNYLNKLGAADVYENYIDWNKAINLYGSLNIAERELELMFNKMDKNNNGFFSYSYLTAGRNDKSFDIELRKCIITSMEEYHNSIEYSELINDKDILILDDTITSGKTISDACEIILNTFKPKSITIITLFSPLT